MYWSNACDGVANVNGVCAPADAVAQNGTPGNGEVPISVTVEVPGVATGEVGVFIGVDGKTISDKGTATIPEDGKDGGRSCLVA